MSVPDAEIQRSYTHTYGDQVGHGRRIRISVTLRFQRGPVILQKKKKKTSKKNEGSRQSKTGKELYLLGLIGVEDAKCNKMA